MAGKKDKSPIYWNMNYKGKLRRTWVMLPICIIIGVAAPFYTASEYDSIVMGLAFDVLLAVVWVCQLLYNMKKAREEEQQAAAQTPAAPGAAAPGAPVAPAAPYPASPDAPYPAAPAVPAPYPAASTAPAPAAPAPYAAPQPVPNVSPAAPVPAPAVPTPGATVPAPTTPAPTPGNETVPPASNVSAGDTDPFAQESGQLQVQMAHLALSLFGPNALASGRVHTAYVHAMVLDGQSKWDCFFHVDDGLTASGDLLKNTPQESRGKFFAMGRSLMDDYRAVCAKYHVDEPTELRIIIDPQTHAMHTDVSYAPLTGDDPFMTWVSQVYSSLHPTAA